MSNIFITGATGFLGSMLINEILSTSNDIIYSLVRGISVEDARNRITAILEKVFEPGAPAKEMLSRVHICLGDITKENLGLQKSTIRDLFNKIDIIYNSAAVTDLNWPLEKVRRINVNGTKNVLDFALLCKKNGRLKKINHISTAYIVGTKECTFKEEDLEIGQNFNNTYEQSKYEAEHQVVTYRSMGLDIDIFRPSIVMGRYKDGMTTSFKMFYQPLHFFSLELFDRIPAISESAANLINVDIVAKAIILISNLSDDKNTNYHIASPNVPTFDYIIDMASKYFGFKKPNFVQPKEIDIHKEYTIVKRKMIEPYIPYFNYFTKFDITNTQNHLQSKKFKFPEIDKDNLFNLFEYCDKNGFIKKDKKNVAVG